MPTRAARASSTRQMAVAGDVPDMEVIFSKLAWKQRVKIFSAPFF